LPKITTGKLREMVYNAAVEAREGRLSAEQAMLVSKMAGRITDSLYAEAKIQRLVIEGGGQPQALGGLPIGQPDE